MQKLNYSRQREAIRNYLFHTATHPTAEEVYENIRRTYPNISLGTVYRNLGLLAKNGEALRIQIDGCDRFDGRTAPHYHFSCDRCKRVFDILTENTADDAGGLYETLNALASEHFSGLIRGHSTVFYGICQECAKNEG